MKKKLFVIGLEVAIICIIAMCCIPIIIKNDSAYTSAFLIYCAVMTVINIIILLITRKLIENVKKTMKSKTNEVVNEINSWGDRVEKEN